MSRFFRNKNSSDAALASSSSSMNSSYMDSKPSTVDATVVKDSVTTHVVGSGEPQTFTKEEAYLNNYNNYASYNSGSSGLLKDDMAPASTKLTSTGSSSSALLGSSYSGSSSTMQSNFTGGNITMQGGQYRGVIHSMPAPTIGGGGFSVTKLEEQELLARGEQIPGKVIKLPEHTGFSISHPEICIAQDKLLISHQPITIAQPPVVIHPEPIVIPQQPFIWKPEPIAIPLPPLTIQPEAITIQREALTVNPDAYVIHRPNLVLNGKFDVKLTHPGQCPPGSVCLSNSDASLSSGSLASTSSSSLSTYDSASASTLGSSSTFNNRSALKY